MPSFVSIVETSTLRNRYGIENIDFLRQLDKLVLKTDHIHLKNVTTDWERTVDFDSKLNNGNNVFCNVCVKYNNNDYKIEFKYNAYDTYNCFQIGIFSKKEESEDYGDNADKYFSVGDINFEENGKLYPYKSLVNGGNRIKEPAMNKDKTSQDQSFNIDGKFNETAFQVLFEYATTIQAARN